MVESETLPEKSTECEIPMFSQGSSFHSVDFSELVKVHWAQVFRVCLQITQNKQDAEDAAQDSFLRAYSRFHQFQGRAQLSTWLVAIARNCSLMLLRKRRRQQVTFEYVEIAEGEAPPFDPPDNRPNQESLLSYAESCERLVRSIAALPVRLREVADLSILNELTLQEVSQMLDLSDSNVKSRLFRARRHLGRFSRWSFGADPLSTHVNRVRKRASRNGGRKRSFGVESSAQQVVSAQIEK